MTVEKLNVRELPGPIKAIADKVDEVIDALNARERERVGQASTELLLKMSRVPECSLPLAVVHPMPDGEAIIARLVASGWARIEDGLLSLTDAGLAQARAMFQSIEDMTS